MQVHGLLYFPPARRRHMRNQETDRSLGEMLRGWRMARNLSVKRLAKLAGVSRRTIDNAEAGENISVAVLRKLMRALEIRSVTISVDDASSAAPSEAFTPRTAASLTAAVRKATAILHEVEGTLGRWSPRQGSSDLDVVAESLITSFAQYVRGLDDPQELATVEESVASLYTPESRRPSSSARPRRRRKSA